MPSENEPNTPSQSNPSSGAAVGGDVNTGGGDFVGRDKITITEETAYNVHGLGNPYLGLRAFTYEDRGIYAGREQVAQETVQRLTAPGAQQTILFITGASGSGKSSFAQAALIPRLEIHYAAYQKIVCHAIFRPSSQPMAMVRDALQKLHLDLTPETLAVNPPKDQINLLLIDQFEELFIQSDASQRVPFCDFLTNLPSFETGRTHILITLRVDYLDELFAIQPLWAIAKEGVELRTMRADDLRNAIQKPLQVTHPQKRFATELLDRLVQDAGEDAALLPLLQVTLAELWKTGKLILSNYHSLTDAIRQRAETVYAFRDHANAYPKMSRPSDEQQELMSILLDLINVSVDGTDRRDVRQRRTRQELEQGAAQRPRLIEELINARLLAASNETRNGTDVEVIDVIHESLIDNWERLRDAIEAQRQLLQHRARFRLWFSEWLRNERNDGYLLLTDMQLAEARALVEGRDIEVQGEEAQRFYRWSVELQEAERQKELQRVKELAEAQRERAQLAETNANQQSRSNKRLRRLSWSLGGILIAALVFIMFAIYMGVQADARSLAWQASEKIRDGNLHLATLFALESRDLVWEVGDQVIQRIPYELPYTNGRLIHTRASVNAIAWSPNGKILASGMDDNTIILWDVGSGLSIRILEGHKNAVRTLDWSPDGQILASGSDDHTIILWNIPNGEISRILYGHEGSVYSVDWNADGRTLASGSADKKVIIWNTTSGEQTHVFQKHEFAVYSVAWNPKGQVLASGSDDHNTIIWNVDDMIPTTPIKQGSNLSPHSSAWNPHGSVLASSDDDNTVSLWDSSNGKRIYRLIGHKSSVLDIAWNPDGKTLASGSKDQSIIIWDAINGKALRKLKASESAISNLAWSPDGHGIAAGGLRTIVIWDIEQEKSVHILRGHEDSVTSLAWNPNGKILASGSSDHAIILWDTISNTISKRLEGHKGIVTSIVWSPDGHTIASGSNDTTIILWDGISGELLRTLEGNKNSVRSVAWSPDGRMLAAGGGNYLAMFSKGLTSDNIIKLYNTSTGELIRTFEGHKAAVSSIEWNSNGRVLASSSYDGMVIFWDVNSGRPLQTFKWYENSITHIAWSPDGKTLAASSYEGVVTLWSDQGNLLRTLKGHSVGVTDIIWEPNSHRLASVGYDTIIFWDSDSGKRLRTINNGKTDSGKPNSTSDRSSDVIDSIAWSPDGNVLAFGLSDNTIQLRPRIFTEDPCHWVVGNFTYLEWITYRLTGVYHRTCPEFSEPYPLSNLSLSQEQTQNIRSMPLLAQNDPNCGKSGRPPCVSSRILPFSIGNYIVDSYVFSWNGRIIIWGTALAIFVGFILFAWWLILRMIRLFWRMITHSFGKN